MSAGIHLVKDSGPERADWPSVQVLELRN